MSRKYISFVVLTIILALFGGCRQQTSNPKTSITPKEVQLTEQEGACGNSVGLNSGDTLVLILERDSFSENTWEVGFYVPQVIRPDKDTEDLSGSSPDNASESQTFRFLAIGEGQVTLVMVYHNPLEKDVPDLKTCEVTVEVK